MNPTQNGARNIALAIIGLCGVALIGVVVLIALGRDPDQLITAGLDFVLPLLVLQVYQTLHQTGAAKPDDEKANRAD